MGTSHIGFFGCYGGTMTVRDAAKVIVVVLLFVTVQQTLMLDINIAGIHPAPS